MTRKLVYGSDTVVPQPPGWFCGFYDELHFFKATPWFYGFQKCCLPRSKAAVVRFSPQSSPNAKRAVEMITHFYGPDFFIPHKTKQEKPLLHRLFRNNTVSHISCYKIAALVFFYFFDRQIIIICKVNHYILEYGC